MRFVTSKSGRSGSDISDLHDHFDRVDWVRNEIQSTLRLELESYEESRPYRLDINTDEKRQRKTLVATSTIPPPKALQIRAGVLINELRAILDSLTCTLATRNNEGASLRSVSFPITESKEEFFKPEAQRKISKLSAADKRLLDRLRPWRGGNDWLYALHVADRLRKHQRLLLTVALSKGGAIRGNFKSTDRWKYGGDLSKGAVVADLALDSSPDVDVTVRVCFSEPAFMKGKELVPVLHDFSSMVEAALKLFD